MEKVSKFNLWSKHYLNNDNPTTFLNKKESAREAGYNVDSEDLLDQIGCRNLIKLTKMLGRWIETDLSEVDSKIKLLKLLEAKETVVFYSNGAVADTRQVEALEVQRKALDIALKLQGMYPPGENKITLKDLKWLSSHDLAD